MRSARLLSPPSGERSNGKKIWGERSDGKKIWGERSDGKTQRVQLILTAHGSADPRSAANAHQVARTVAALRRGIDVKVAFCEQNSPNLRDVLAGCVPGSVVVPLLLADAYHARIDIPAMIEDSGVDVHQAEVLGEDDRLIHVLSQRLTHAGVSRLDGRIGVLVTAVGSSSPAANARTATVATGLVAGTHWQATAAFATGPQANLAEATEQLHARGATNVVVAPWFLAHGRITDRIADFAGPRGMPMCQPLGSHRLVADTVLDRFDAVLTARRAA